MSFPLVTSHSQSTERLRVLSTALTQFIENSCEDEDAREIAVAESMLDEVNIALISALEGSLAGAEVSS